MTTDDRTSGDLWADLLMLWQSDDFDEDRNWELVSGLNQRGDAVVVDWALPLLSSPDPNLRNLAARVLAQHGCLTGRPFGTRVNPQILAALEVEDDPDALASLVSALGHADDPTLLPALLRWASSPDPEIREIVAGALPGLGRYEPDPMMVRALIALSRDEAPNVRDWATFSLGSLCDQESRGEVDRPVIREALIARLNDPWPESDAAAEAARGLAILHDPVIYPYLDAWLNRPDISELVLEAVVEYGDRRLLPKLSLLRAEPCDDDDPWVGTLDRAIADLSTR